MGRAHSQSFAAEFTLEAEQSSIIALNKRLLAHRQLYNAALGEALKRVNAMRASPAWSEATRLERGSQQKKQAFALLRKDFGVRCHDLEKFAQQTRDSCFIAHHAGSHDTQATAARAFNAVDAYICGQRGRPRFRSARRFRSFEGKSNEAVLRLRRVAGRWCVLSSNLVLLLHIPRQHKDTWQQEALERRCKYVRLLRRELRGKTIWVAQLVMEGTTPQKAHHVRRPGVVGIDLGPRTVAAVGEDALGDQLAFQAQLSPSSEGPRRNKRRLARALDRSRRATNPTLFDDKGRARPGKHRWQRSHGYERLVAKMREEERKLQAGRKRDHGMLCNKLLALGTTIKTEKLQYKSWQKNFGRSVGNHAPSRFLTTLSRKAENAGGQLVLFSPHKTRLSQYDHKAHAYSKKPLSQRRHMFADGRNVDRDVYSAWLARFVEQDMLGTTQLETSWAAVGALLEVLAVPRMSSNTTHKRRLRKNSSTSGPKAQCVRAGRQDKAGGRRSRPDGHIAGVLSGEICKSTARISVL